MNLLRLAKFRPRLYVRPRTMLDVGLAFALVFCAHAVYRSARGVVQLCDSTYSLVVAERLLTHGSVDLSPCIPTDAIARAKLPGYRPAEGLPYHLTRRTNPLRPDDSPRVLYGYPLGSTLLSLPFVHYSTVMKGRSLLDADGVPRYQAEGALQVRIASIVSAAIVLLIFITTRFYCAPIPASLLAAGFAFGSPIFSTLARSLWSHTWMAFWLAAAVLVLIGLRRTTERTWKTDLLFGSALGTALFWALFCRQHAVLSLAAVGVFLLVNHRRVLLFAMAGGGLWVAALVIGSLAVFGTVQPPSVYAPNVVDGRDVVNRFAWHMVSPARGLLVFCPYVAVIGGLLIGCRRQLKDAGLLLPAGLAIASHTALISSYNGWHANWAYGPRYFCDVLPWFSLLAAMSTGALLSVPTSNWRKWMPASLLAVCFAWGVFVHVRGANDRATWDYNYVIQQVGDEAAVKDWRHPQFLAGLTFAVRPNGTITAQ